MNTNPTAPKKTFTDTNANSFSDKVLRWELIEARLAPLLDTMPYVKPVHAELTQLIADMKSHEFDLKGARAHVRQAVADRKSMLKKGDGIRSRLASALAFEHGSTSVLLSQFGLRPRGRKRKATPPATPTPQPEAQSGAQLTAPATGSGGGGTMK